MMDPKKKPTGTPGPPPDGIKGKANPPSWAPAHGLRGTSPAKKPAAQNAMQKALDRKKPKKPGYGKAKQPSWSGSKSPKWSWD
jgi:hypothetical protein